MCRTLWAGFVIFSLLAAVPATQALPLPNPMLQAPSDIQGHYDVETNTLALSWTTPTGLAEDQAEYLVYLNGEVAAIAPDPAVTLPAPEGPTVVSVSAMSGGYQSTLSEPGFFSGSQRGEGMPFFVTLFVLDFPPDDVPPCSVLILGLNPNPPYVFHVDRGCIWRLIPV